MMNKFIVVLLLACYLLFGGCSTNDIQNHKANLSQVKIGMTTEQVSALLGPPIRRGQAVTAAGTTAAIKIIPSFVMMNSSLSQ